MAAARKAVLTGASGTLGKHIAQGLVASGFDVLCCVRREKAAKEISKFGCSVVMADLSTKAGPAAVAAHLKGAPVHCLVNNAAITTTSRQETNEGHEMQWAVNVLAYHWLTKALRANLEAAARDDAAFRPRVVYVASSYAGCLDMSDPEFKKRPYDPNAAYQATKQANRMLAKAWSDKLSATGIDVVSCHPGVATSPVSLGVGFDFDRSEAAAQRGAETPVHLATADDLVSGAYYYIDLRPRPCDFSKNVAECNRLWDICDTA